MPNECHAPRHPGGPPFTQPPPFRHRRRRTPLSYSQYEINSLHIGMVLYKLNLLTLSTPLACCLAYATPPIGACSTWHPFRSLNYSLSHFHSRGSSSFFIFVILWGSVIAGLRYFHSRINQNGELTAFDSSKPLHPALLFA